MLNMNKIDTSDIRWAKIFGEYLDRCGISLPQSPYILNVGCGQNVVWNFLGAVLYTQGAGLGLPRYFGIDLDKNELAQARRHLGDIVNLIVGDARYVSHFLKASFHLAVVQHPDLSTSRERPRVWQKIFEETGKLLHRSGVLILTSFWINDHIPAQVALQKAKFEIIYSGTNSFPGKKFDKSNNGEALIFDKYVLLARKTVGS